jgi:hypothetical protein
MTEQETELTPEELQDALVEQPLGSVPDPYDTDEDFAQDPEAVDDGEEGVDHVRGD